MTATVPAKQATDVDHGTPAPRLRFNVFASRNTRVVHVTGELDLATRRQLVAASTAGHHPTTMIDLGGVTFMDCSGYSSLVAARRIIESEGRTLTITGQTGQPARLWRLIGDLDTAAATRAEPVAGSAAHPSVTASLTTAWSCTSPPTASDLRRRPACRRA